jgi:hypothetical protein
MKNGKIYFDPDNLDTEMACKPITTIKVDINPEVDKVPVIMIDRGECHFTAKVKNVESIGGHIALIVDKASSKSSPSNIIMSDDGTGQDITIPGVLIGYKDGEIIKSFYKQNPGVDIIVEFEFEMVGF